MRVIMNTRQYMSYETFSNLNFRPLLKIYFLNFEINLKDTNGEKTPRVSVGIIQLVLMLKKFPIAISNENPVSRWPLQDK